MVESTQPRTQADSLRYMLPNFWKLAEAGMDQASGERASYVPRSDQTKRAFWSLQRASSSLAALSILNFFRRFLKDVDRREDIEFNTFHSFGSEVGEE